MPWLPIRRTYENQIGETIIALLTLYSYLSKNNFLNENKVMRTRKTIWHYVLFHKKIQNHNQFLFKSREIQKSDIASRKTRLQYRKQSRASKNIFVSQQNGFEIGL